MTVGTITFKVLVVGSFGVGKTTFIDQISEVPIVGTEVATSGEEAEVKPTTTVGIEYGFYSIGEDDSQVTLLLFGTPGQDRFSDARDIAAQGIDGIVVIVDGNEPATWAIGEDLYTAYDPLAEIPTVFVVNRWPSGQDPPPGLEWTVACKPAVTSISCGNVTDASDARRFLIDLLDLILRMEVGDEGVSQT